MVAIVVFTLFTTLIAGGLKNIEVHLSKSQEILLGAFLAALSAFICYAFIRKATIAFYSKKLKDISRTHYNPQVALELEKAEKQLQKALSSSKGDTFNKISSALSDLQDLNVQVKSQRDPATAASEYAAVEKIFSFLQIMSACLMAFAHGANDVSWANGSCHQRARYRQGVRCCSHPLMDACLGRSWDCDRPCHLGLARN
jgi:PiT family inorganic phosphate transporter